MCREYTATCFTCGEAKRLAAFHWHVVTWYVTADKKRPVPDGARFGLPCRSCSRCFQLWLDGNADLDGAL